MDGSVSTAAWGQDQAPVVVTPTRQDFLGCSYYLCGRYFQRDGRRLHREVWAAANGAIPDGWHVHHRDGNCSNNHPSNLQILSAVEHLSHHAVEYSQSALQRWHSGHGATMLELAAQWHKSDEGRQWHREHYQRHKDKLHEKRFTRSCVVCGSRYATASKRSCFCSRNCKAEHRRRSGVDDESRICAVCGSTFTINKYKPACTCSRACRAKVAWERRRASGGGVGQAKRQGG